MNYVWLVRGQKSVKMVSYQGVIVGIPDDVGSFFSVKTNPMNLKAIIPVVPSVNQTIMAFFYLIRTKYLDFMTSSSHFASQIVSVNFSAGKVSGKEFMENVEDLHLKFELSLSEAQAIGMME